jgi:fatty-acyl-CoA synthase
MRRDRRGFYYFVDRVGDTFRWRGENVSAGEVWSALGAFPGVVDGVVYGVEVDGYDGRAGMAALVLAGSFDPAAFHQHVSALLPEYARPQFVRVIRSLDVTGTFKPRKHDLVHDGFDPARVSEPLFIIDRRARTYVALDAKLHRELIAGDVRL